MIAAYLMATAAAEAAAGLPGGGMAFSTVAVICGVGTVGNCTTVGPEFTDDTDATEDDAGDRGVGVIDSVGVETGRGSAGGGGGVSVGVGSDMTSSMMVAGVDATDPSSSWKEHNV